MAATVLAMNRSLAALPAFLLVLAGCSNSTGLTIGMCSGGACYVRTDQGSFDPLPAGARLDDGEMGTAGRLSGMCDLTRSGTAPTESWSAIVTLNRGVTDANLQSVTIMQRSDQPATAGRVEAVFGTTTFTSSASAPCTVTMGAQDAAGGGLSLSGVCTVSNGAMTKSVDFQLQLIGCSTGG
jgi:hypothetical protein